MVGPRADELSRTRKGPVFFALDAARAALEFRLRTGCNMSDSTVQGRPPAPASTRQSASKIQGGSDDQTLCAHGALLSVAAVGLVFAGGPVLAQQPPAPPNKAGTASSAARPIPKSAPGSGAYRSRRYGDETSCRSRSSSCRRASKIETFGSA